MNDRYCRAYHGTYRSCRGLMCGGFGMDCADNGWGAGRMAQQAPRDIEHDFAIYGKKPSPAQKETREQALEAKGTVGMPAQRRTIGLLKMIRNMAFAHRCLPILRTICHETRQIIISIITVITVLQYRSCPCTDIAAGRSTCRPGVSTPRRRCSTTSSTRSHGC